MYFTIENINTLDSIISNLSIIDNEKEQRDFLDRYVEDPEMLFKIVKKIEQYKFSPKQVKHCQGSQEVLKCDFYTEDEIRNLFSHKNNETIMQEYSLADLKKMYISIYKKKPLSNSTKKQIVSSLRERFHTIKRAEAFALLAEERNRKN